MKKNKYFNKKYYLVFLFISLFYLINNFYSDGGYWFDEWVTLFVSNPNVNITEIYNRLSGHLDININGQSTKLGENVPPIYYLVLRFFFSNFGFIAENGRIFSLFFFLLSIFLFYHLLNNFCHKNYSLIGAIILSLNPLLIWMANETRIDTFLIFFSILNIYLFFISYYNKKLINYVLLFSSNIFLLSIYPLTLSIIISQIIFLFFNKLMFKEKKNYLILLIIISIGFYFLTNQKYLISKSLLDTKILHTQISNNFFIGFYFNTYFGNLYFGGFYLLISVILTVINYKKILKERNIIFLIILISSTYAMIILSSKFFIPIASPRYIIFIIPVIIYYLIYNFFLLEKTFTKYIKKDALFNVLLIFFITNIIITNDNRPIKKPPFNQALDIIQSNNEKNIYIIYDKYLSTYVPTIKKFKEYNFKILNEDFVSNDNIKSFAHLCINNPRFAVGKRNLPDDFNCSMYFEKFDIQHKVYINDFIINFYKNKQ